jgi:Zn finger protein HypA/HybF involved in hydrogenase expression
MADVIHPADNNADARPECIDCGEVLTSEESHYYGLRCEICERIATELTSG